MMHRGLKNLKLKTMCFNTTKSARAKIAKTDIECWKYLFPDNSPPFPGVHGINTPYQQNEISEKVKIRKNGFCSIDKGYHSYKNENTCINNSKHYSEWMDIEVIIKKFIIPAGTCYYENSKEYVSETIIML